MTLSLRSRTFLAGVALILATNAVALIGVAYNRKGEAESTLKLTQRELWAPYSWNFGAENSGLGLGLRWRAPDNLSGPLYDNVVMQPNGYANRRGWLDRAKLAELGFDVSPPENTPKGRRYYEKLLPKDVLLVLEFDGPAYDALLERARQHLKNEKALLAANAGKPEFQNRTKRAEEWLKAEERQNSRLFVVDAGLDVKGLRAKYPDRRRYAIVSGQVQPWLTGKADELLLAGSVKGISIDEINVPLAFRHALDPDLKNNRRVRSPAGKSFEITVAFGKRLEPWITAVSDKTGQGN